MRLDHRLRPLALVLPALFLCFAAGSLDPGAQAQTRDGDATGSWRTEDGVSIVEITRCGESLCGHLVSFPAIAGNPSLNEALCNLQILGGFHRGGDGRWVDGWIAAVEEDEVYQASIRAVSFERLDVRAYVGNERNGETITWSRHSGAIDRCAAPR